MPKGCLLKVLKSKVVFITSYIKLIFVGYSTAILRLQLNFLRFLVEHAVMVLNLL